MGLEATTATGDGRGRSAAARDIGGAAEGSQGRHGEQPGGVGEVEAHGVAAEREHGGVVRAAVSAPSKVPSLSL
jgi:hypothetical protein